VSILHRTLFVLVTLRLLVPPGVCLCKLSSPAARVLADLLGREAPAPEPEEDEDHAAGCPASKVSEGLGVRPAPAPAQPDLALGQGVVDRSSPPAGLAPPEAQPAPAFAAPPETPLFLMLCALRI
jgi:hypothetical protein